jgi:hypothetical protein
MSTATKSKKTQPKTPTFENQSDYGEKKFAYCKITHPTLPGSIEYARNILGTVLSQTHKMKEEDPRYLKLKEYIESKNNTAPAVDIKHLLYTSSKSPVRFGYTVRLYDIATGVTGSASSSEGTGTDGSSIVNKGTTLRSIKEMYLKEDEFDYLYENEDEDQEDEDAEEWFDEVDVDDVASPRPKAVKTRGLLSLFDRVANERFIEKRVVYEGGLSAPRLSLYELTEIVSMLAQTIENGRPFDGDESLIHFKFITTIDLAIAELRQKKCPYLIMREHLGGAFEIIDPNNCSFNDQDLKEFYLHNTKKSFD